MKSLYKKIGVGALVVGLLAGGSLSSGLVAQADSGIVKKQQEQLFEKIEELGYKYGFESIKIAPKENISKLFGERIGQLRKGKISFEEYSDFESEIRQISLESKSLNKPFVRVEVEDLNLILVFF